MNSRNPNRASTVYLGADGSWHGWVTVGFRDDGAWTDAMCAARPQGVSELGHTDGKHVVSIVAARDRGNDTSGVRLRPRYRRRRTIGRRPYGGARGGWTGHPHCPRCVSH